MKYSDKLKDPRWQKKRFEIFERDGWKCTECGNIKATLHIHHKKYHRGLDPWEYNNNELTTLCCDCHDRESDVADKKPHSALFREIRKAERCSGNGLLLKLLQSRNLG